jgi:glutamate racemase
MIGIFDSGIGGLTVARAVREQIPNADILYFGDVARMPYGNKSAETVTEYSREIVRYLIRRGAEVIIIACNTASAVAAEKLRAEFSVPILDVIKPAVAEALNAKRYTLYANDRIAVLGTRGTIGSGAYQKALRKSNGKVKVFPLACPMFVPLVEEGFVGTREGRQIVRYTLAPLAGKNMGEVILGCTHYPLLKKEIAAVFPKARLIDSSAVAEEAAALYRGIKDRGRTEIVVTDLTPHFKKLAEKIIGKNIVIKKIIIDQLTRKK